MLAVSLEQCACPPRVGKPLARPRSRQAAVLHPHGLHWLPKAGGRARACAPLMSTVLTRKSDSAVANSCPVDACRTLETGAGAPAAAAHATAKSAAHNSRPVRGPAGRRGIVGPGRVQRGVPAPPLLRGPAPRRGWVQDSASIFAHGRPSRRALPLHRIAVQLRSLPTAAPLQPEASPPSHLRDAKHGLRPSAGFSLNPVVRNLRGGPMLVGLGRERVCCFSSCFVPLSKRPLDLEG